MVRMVRKAKIDSSDVARVAEKVLDVMAQPYDLGFDSLAVTPSIGVVMSGDDRGESGILTKSADTAMRRAKAGGGNNFCFFNDRMHHPIGTTSIPERHAPKHLPSRSFRKNCLLNAALSAGASTGKR